MCLFPNLTGRSPRPKPTGRSCYTNSANKHPQVKESYGAGGVFIKQVLIAAGSFLQFSAFVLHTGRNLKHRSCHQKHQSFSWFFLILKTCMASWSAGDWFYMEMV